MKTATESPLPHLSVIVWGLIGLVSNFSLIVNIHSYIIYAHTYLTLCISMPWAFFAEFSQNYKIFKFALLAVKFCFAQWFR